MDLQPVRDPDGRMAVQFKQLLAAIVRDTYFDKASGGDGQHGVGVRHVQSWERVLESRLTASRLGKSLVAKMQQHAVLPASFRIGGATTMAGSATTMGGRSATATAGATGGGGTRPARLERRGSLQKDPTFDAGQAIAACMLAHAFLDKLRARGRARRLLQVRRSVADIGSDVSDGGSPPGPPSAAAAARWDNKRADSVESFKPPDGELTLL